MSEICDELRLYASHCFAIGQSTTADKLRQAADWIDIQQKTIREQKLTIAELRKVAGDKVAAPRGSSHSRK